MLEEEEHEGEEGVASEDVVQEIGIRSDQNESAVTREIVREDGRTDAFLLSDGSSTS